MKNLVFLLLIFATTTTAWAEIYASKEFGFFVDLPAEVETVRLESPRGPLTTIASFKEKEGFLYMVTIFEIEELKKFAEMDPETSKVFLESFFNSMMGEIRATEIESHLADGFAWPMLRFSYREIGKFADGGESLRRGYSFVKNKSVFTISIYSFPESADLGMELDRFTRSFAFASASDIDSFLNQRSTDSGRPIFTMALLQKEVQQRRLMTYGHFVVGMNMVEKFSAHGSTGADVLKMLDGLGGDVKGLVGEYWEAERRRDFLHEIEAAESVSRPIAVTRSLEMEMRSQFYERRMPEIRAMVNDLHAEASR